MNRKLHALNLGCGDSVNPYKSFYVEEWKRETPIEWTRLDIREGEDIRADVVWDLKDKYPLPFKDCKFDYVYCHSVLEHIPVSVVAKKLLPEIYRIAKVDGTFEVHVPNLFLASKEVLKGKIYEGLRRLYSADLWRDPSEPGYYPESRHIMCYTLGSLIDMIKAAGFNIKNATDMYANEEGDIDIKALKGKHARF